jgi:hypothetical protein
MEGRAVKTKHRGKKKFQAYFLITTPPLAYLMLKLDVSLKKLKNLGWYGYGDDDRKFVIGREKRRMLWNGLETWRK